MIKLTPRHFVLPLVALAVIASLPPPAESGRSDGSCGPALGRTGDPAIRAAFERFERAQSPAAARICAHYRNAR